jgi:hypothetical protein
MRLEDEMRKVSRLVVLGAATNLIGCIVPRPFATRTEIITAADSTPVFGTQAELRIFDQSIVLGWDKATRGYTPRNQGSGSQSPTRALRVARLKSDIYLFQAKFEASEGYVLVPVRISKAREATPLTCQAQETAAADFGVRIAAGFDHERELRGDRAGIIGFLATTLPTCTPLFRIDTFEPPRAELVAAAAAPGPSSSGGCKPCSERGCIQGTVTDESGAAVAGVTVRAKPGSPVTTVRTALSNDAGEFHITGLPEGSYRLVVESTGYATILSEDFVIKPGFTHVFESPIELKVAIGPEETIVVFMMPRRCENDGERPYH